MFNPAISFHVFSLKPPTDMEAVDCSSSESETECDSSSSSLPPIETTDVTALALPATTSAALRPPRMDDSIEPFEGVAIFRKITSDSSNVDDSENNIFYFNFNPPKKE